MAYYSFNDCTANDSSSNARNGFILGTPTCVAGKVGKALSFNSDAGQGDYIILPQLGTVFNAGFSVCAWVKFSTTPGYFERIIDFGNGEAADNIVFYRYSTGNTLSFWSQLNNSSYSQVDATNVINGQWKFYCATQDVATSTAKIYVNSTLNNTKSPFPLANVSRSNNFIGHSNWTGQDDFRGLMDNIRIYNRALTVPEIVALYNEGIPVNGAINSLNSTVAHTVSCKNNSTGQVINIPATTATTYNCEGSGLAVSAGQNVTVTINGNAQ